jgi:hypothetical protein
MPITINGTGTITGISAGGLPDASVTAADLAASLDLSSKTVTLPSGTGGKILQVVQTVKTDTSSTSSTSATAISGLSASITPTTSGNKVLVIADVFVGNTTTNYGGFLYLYKGGSVIAGATGDASGSRMRSTSFQRQSHAPSGIGVPISYLDTTSGTSSITYQIYFSAESGSTVVINRTGSDSDTVALPRTISTITLMEVAA